MPKLEINYTAEQMKAMELIASDPQAWIQNAWDNRARQAIDEICDQVSDKKLSRMSPQEKLKIIKNLKHGKP